MHDRAIFHIWKIHWLINRIAIIRCSSRHRPHLPRAQPLVVYRILALSSVTTLLQMLDHESGDVTSRVAFWNRSCSLVLAIHSSDSSTYVNFHFWQ